MAITVRRQPAGLAAAKPAVNRVTLRCHVDTLTGYGQLALGLVRELTRRGIDCVIVPMNIWEGGEGWKQPIPAFIRERLVGSSPDEWELFIAPAPNRPDPGKRTVMLTMWESNRLPADTVRSLNHCEAVITPSEWCQLTFDAAGVKVPLYRLPLAIDTETFTPAPFPEDCLFGASGRVAHGGLRKGIYQVYEAFRLAFPDETDVGLSLKVFPDCNLPAIDDRRVNIIRAAVTDQQMAEWYQGLTCFVSAAAAEGFGLQPLQALACGRPVIATQATGHREYFGPSVGYPVRYDLVRAEDAAPGNGYYTGYWFLPDLQDMAAQMRKVYLDRETARQRGAAGAERAKLFGWEPFGDRLVTLLRHIGMLE